jgi:DNA-binding NarL/FixJ family response regulator
VPGAPGSDRVRSPCGLLEPLSQAEARVLRYLPTGLSMPEIADQLYLSVNTVRTHTRHIYDKLGALVAAACYAAGGGVPETGWGVLLGGLFVG